MTDVFPSWVPADTDDALPQLPQLPELELVDRYRYDDEAGELLYVVARFIDADGHKTFRQARLVDGRWSWGLGDTRRVLYRLPKIVEHLAGNTRDPMYVVEGEKDVHAIERAGATATCNPMGAGKWSDDYSESLQGARRVVVVQDRDDVGRRHAREVIESLARVGVTAELVEPAEGKDVSDHLAAGHALDDLVPVQDPTDELEEARRVEPFVGLSHADVLELRFTEEPDLIAGLVPRAVVVTTAGLPETYKGWLCTKKADVIARGEGEVLGCAAVAQGPVGYFWQDDSTRNEAERVQLYASVHATPPDLPIRWFLNEGLQLPRDLDRLRATIEELGLVYVVLDSFYNVAAEIDLKERGAGMVYAQLKEQICDTTGCTIDVVDHMPWATDTNRKRLRSYGDVFKNAAVRAGLYIDADGKKLYVEARGNNIRGFKRTPAYWDEDALELRLADTSTTPTDEAELDEEVLAFVEKNPGLATTRIAGKVEDGGLGKRRSAVQKSLKRLEDAGRLRLMSSGELGRPGTAHYWFSVNHAESEPSRLFGTPRDGLGPQPSLEGEPINPSPPRRGDGSPDGSLESGGSVALEPGDAGYLEELSRAHAAGVVDDEQRRALRLEHLSIIGTAGDRQHTEGET